MIRARPIKPATPPPAMEVPWFERVLFFVLLAVLGMRPLISESYQRLELPFLAAMGTPEGSTPAITAWLDSLMLIAAVAALVRRSDSWGKAKWAAVGVGLLGVALALSVWVAGDRRSALNAGFSLVVAVLSAGALVTLMRAAWMPRLLLAALLASGCASATKCFTQRAYEFKDTADYWNEHKAELVSSGVNVDDPSVINFERRMRAGDAFGYQSHPNVAGSLLMMWSLVAVGALLGACASGPGDPRGERVALIVLASLLLITLAVALALTGSRGGMVAAAVGAVLTVVFGRWRARIALHAGRTTALLAAAYGLVVLGGLAYGLRNGTLPHASLAFRWNYWTAAARAYEHAPLTGIGRGNFADAFLLCKPMESTEDVRDPHNLWLSLLVEMGPLGLIAGGVLLAGCICAALRRVGAPVDMGSDGGGITVGRLVVAALAVLLLQLVFSGAMLLWALAALWVAELAGVWIIALIAATWLLERLARAPGGWNWLLAGIAAALAGALVHGLIDFALLTPAGLALFVGLAAIALARPGDPRETATPSAKTVPALLGMLLVAADFALVTLPTMRVEYLLSRMRNTGIDRTRPDGYDEILKIGQQAIAADPLDPAAALDVARITLAIGTKSQLPIATRRHVLEKAEQFARVALGRNPHSSYAHVSLAATYGELEDAWLLDDAEQANAAQQHAVDEWQAAVALRPNDPRLRISAGEAAFARWDDTREAAAGREAAVDFAAALRIDATRKPEEVVRLRSVELTRIYDRLRVLERAGFGGMGTCAPASAPSP